jgi:hypothetical protein
MTSSSLYSLYTVVRWQLVACRLPVNRAVHEVDNGGNHVVYRADELASGVALAEGHRALCHGCEKATSVSACDKVNGKNGLTGKVDGHAVWRAELIVAGVALANGRVRVVDTREDAGPAQFRNYALR